MLDFHIPARFLRSHNFFQIANTPNFREVKMTASIGFVNLQTIFAMYSASLTTSFHRSDDLLPMRHLTCNISLIYAQLYFALYIYTMLNVEFQLNRIISLTLLPISP